MCVEKYEKSWECSRETIFLLIKTVDKCEVFQDYKNISKSIYLHCI